MKKLFKAIKYAVFYKYNKKHRVGILILLFLTCSGIILSDYTYCYFCRKFEMKAQNLLYEINSTSAKYMTKQNVLLQLGKPNFEQDNSWVYKYTVPDVAFSDSIIVSYLAFGHFNVIHLKDTITFNQNGIAVNAMRSGIWSKVY